MSITELRRKLRTLKKLKRDLRKGSVERKDVNRRMKLMKAELKDLLKPTAQKEELINRITELRTKLHKPITVDLRNYTEEQLTIHLERLQNARTKM